MANASRVRTSESGLDSLLTRAASWFASHGRADFIWFLGPSATPAAVSDLLQERGAAFEATGTAMVLDQEPEPAPAMDIRVVKTPQQLGAFRELMLLSQGGKRVDHSTT